MRNKQQNQNNSKLKNIVLNSIIVFLVVVIVLGIFVKMLFVTPSEYVPAAAGDSEEVTTYLTHKLGPDFYNNIQLDDPFWILVDQQGLNEIVAMWEWPIDMGLVVIETPSASFVPDKIQLFGRIDFGRFPVITTVTFSPELDENGMLTLNLERIKAGLVNITTLGKTLILKLIDAELNAAPEDFDYQWLEDLRGAVAENRAFDSLYPVDEETSIRVSDLRLDNDKLDLLFTPVSRE